MASRCSNTSSTQQTVKILVDAGADLNLQNENNRTALMMASINSNTDSTEQTVKMLINAGADLNIKEKDGWTALMLVSYSDTDSVKHIIKILIDAGTNVNLKNNDNLTALHLIIMYNRSKNSGQIVKMLIDAGSDLEILIYGLNILMLACDVYNNAISKEFNMCPPEESIRMLIEAGVDLNQICSNEQFIDITAFDIFIIKTKNYSKNKIFNLFIRHGAKSNLTDKIIIKKIQRRRKKLLFEDKIFELELENKYLRAELDCHPDSEFVERVRERFESNKKIMTG